MSIVLITGGSGLIGRHLTERLLHQGHAVRWLGRSASQRAGVQGFRWDIAAGFVDPAALEGIDHIVHLAGAGIADKRWTRPRVADLIASRTDTARALFRACRANGIVPASFISAAGIGYYGASTTAHSFTESDAPGTDTIARISAEWERAVDEWAPLCRVVKLRTPVVLASEGGALPALAKPVRMGFGAPLGSGQQWMPWVHIDDLCAAYMSAMNDSGMSGAYNVIGDQATNAVFTSTVAQVLKRKLWLPAIPAWLLRAVLGEMADLVLEGSPVDGGRLRRAGFMFRFEELGEALTDLLVELPLGATAHEA